VKQDELFARVAPYIQNPELVMEFINRGGADIAKMVADAEEAIPNTSGTLRTDLQILVNELGKLSPSE